LVDGTRGSEELNTTFETPTERRRGRRSGANQTREAILDAARASFAKYGYSGATIRKIAQDAGVDAALVMQFYSSKEYLFAATVSITPGALSRFALAYEGPEEFLGERVARAFFSVWEGDPSDAQPMFALLRSAINSEKAAEQLRDFLQLRITAALGPERAVRVGIVSSMLVGLVVGRDIVRAPVLVELDSEAIVALIAPALQLILTGDASKFFEESSLDQRSSP
jgi:AcrR family transcriptional regulator